MAQTEIKGSDKTMDIQITGNKHSGIVRIGQEKDLILVEPNQRAALIAALQTMEGK